MPQGGNQQQFTKIAIGAAKSSMKLFSHAASNRNIWCPFLLEMVQLMTCESSKMARGKGYFEFRSTSLESLN